MPANLRAAAAHAAAGRSASASYHIQVSDGSADQAVCRPLHIPENGIPMTTTRRLITAAIASGLLLGATPTIGQADAAPLKAKAVKVDNKAKFRGTFRKV